MPDPSPPSGPRPTPHRSPEPAGFTLRRLTPADAAAFHALRQEGFARRPLQFRVAPEDEAAFTPEQVGARLAREYVVGGFVPGGPSGGRLAGIGGLGRFAGAKLRHKALLWGMYVGDAARGLGLGDAIVGALLAYACDEDVEVVQLTVVADNPRARRLYERWGFRAYGLEAAAVKVAHAGGRPGAVYVDEVLMAVRIADAPRGAAPVHPLAAVRG